jgi:hypothetical protein
LPIRKEEVAVVVVEEMEGGVFATVAFCETNANSYSPAATRVDASV